MSHEVTTAPLVGIEARPGSGHYGVFDHGAHVWAWQPNSHQPVLWNSAKSAYESGQPIRGGVPLVFPWFGMGPAGTLKPAHGFARLQAWNRRSVEDTIDTDGTLIVEYQMDQVGAGPQPEFPHAFTASLTVVFTPEFMKVALLVSNAGDVPFTYEEALHTYLAVGDVTQVSIEGLEDASYLDRAAGAPKLECVQEGPITITAETDRLYSHEGAVELIDPVGGRRLSVSKEGSLNTVVWNPWVAKSAAMPDFGDDEWRSMICIEAANALTDAVRLAPGESHVLKQRISVVDSGQDSTR
ncbi:MAG: D-hexose-6-phosphate mutarotase [Arachnia sp.]